MSKTQLLDAWIDNPNSYGARSLRETADLAEILEKHRFWPIGEWYSCPSPVAPACVIRSLKLGGGGCGDAKIMIQAVVLRVKW